MSDQEKKRASVDKAAGEANEMSEERLTFSCSYECICRASPLERLDRVLHESLLL